MLNDPTVTTRKNGESSTRHSKAHDEKEMIRNPGRETKRRWKSDSLGHLRSVAPSGKRSPTFAACVQTPVIGYTCCLRGPVCLCVPAGLVSLLFAVCCGLCDYFGIRLTVWLGSSKPFFCRVEQDNRRGASTSALQRAMEEGRGKGGGSRR